MVERLWEALRTLSGDELYVIAAMLHDCSERDIAEELSASRCEVVTRDRVHGIKRAAFAKLRRYLEHRDAA